MSDYIPQDWDYIATNGYITECFYSYIPLLKKYLRKSGECKKTMRIIEFGCGYSSKIFSDEIDYFRTSGRAFGIGLENSKYWFEIFSKMFPHIFYTPTFSIIESFSTILQPESIDFAFIDMDMDDIRENREKLLKLVDPFVKKDGIIVFHDAERHNENIFSKFNIIDQMQVRDTKTYVLQKKTA